jgi:hypothetical protein
MTNALNDNKPKYDPSKTYWLSSVPAADDFGQPIKDVFIDGATKMGPWGLMTPLSYSMFGRYPDQLGTGIGQKYEKQSNGTWMKVEG